MKLYYAPRTRSTRPRWLLEELGVPYELVRVDLSKGEQNDAEYIATVHPHGHVPALQDDSVTMMESVAICLYLADKFPEKGFAPASGTPERAQYFQWLVYAVATIEPALVKVFLKNPADLEEGKSQFNDVARVLTKAVKGKDFILGEKFSTADVVLGSLLSWAKSMGLLKEHTELEGYVKRLTERPAFRRAQA